MALLHFSIYSESLCRPVDVSAMIPIDGSLAARPPLKTLYLLGGLYSGEREWLQYTRISLWAREKGLALFCPAGENSFYLPRADGTDPLRFVSRELPELTRRLFPLSRERSDTWIGGMSMGGYGALNAAFTCPETFSRVIALSTAFNFRSRTVPGHPDAAMRPDYFTAMLGSNRELPDPLSLARQLPAGQMPEIFLACGEQDGFFPDNEAFARAMANDGRPVTFVRGPGDHSWEYWDASVRQGLAWAFGDQ